MSFTVRRLTPDDAALYQPVRLQGLRDHPEAFGASFQTEAGMSLEAVARRLARGATWGASTGEGLVGITSLVVSEGLKSEHKATVVGVYVRPEARGSGVASALMRAALDHAQGLVELVQLGVASDNAAARRLYERFGFVAYGTEPLAYKLADGRYVDDLLMWRRMDPASPFAGELSGND